MSRYEASDSDTNLPHKMWWKIH